ncbi:MAG TPA: hypothetical protein VF466_01230 [Candidatus Saccharimonadales bacterium]
MQKHLDDQSQADLDEVVTRSGLVAHRLTDDMSWGVGDIRPQPDRASPEDQRELVHAVMEHLKPVTQGEAAYCTCTDGRLPIRLVSGERPPVREQLVGADIVSAFYVAEALGKRFYADATAPAAVRVLDVAHFLHENGWLPSTHMNCGAASGFLEIVQNSIRFSRSPKYRTRLRMLLPEGVYDPELQEDIIADIQERLDGGAYKDLTADTFVSAVRQVSGDHAIVEIKDDGRGVNGHVEEMVMRILVDGKALSTVDLAKATHGRQVFGVNDLRMARLARLFARGNDQDYRTARIALEDFASAGHGTLAKNLPTYVITNS